VLINRKFALDFSLFVVFLLSGCSSADIKSDYSYIKWGWDLPHGKDIFRNYSGGPDSIASDALFDDKVNTSEIIGMLGSFDYEGYIIAEEMIVRMGKDGLREMQKLVVEADNKLKGKKLSEDAERRLRHQLCFAARIIGRTPDHTSKEAIEIIIENRYMGYENLLYAAQKLKLKSVAETLGLILNYEIHSPLVINYTDSRKLALIASLRGIGDPASLYYLVKFVSYPHSYFAKRAASLVYLMKRKEIIPLAINELLKPESEEREEIYCRLVFWNDSKEGFASLAKSLQKENYKRLAILLEALTGWNHEETIDTNGLVDT
jgi:hypothetical protein